MRLMLGERTDKEDRKASSEGDLTKKKAKKTVNPDVKRIDELLVLLQEAHHTSLGCAACQAVDYLKKWKGELLAKRRIPK